MLLTMKGNSTLFCQSLLGFSLYEFVLGSLKFQFVESADGGSGQPRKRHLHR